MDNNNLNKLQFKTDKVKYLGHVFRKGIVEIDPERTKAIVDYDVPKNRKDLQRLLGMVNYLRAFTPDVANQTAPLRSLLKKNVEFVWIDNIHTQCLNEIKRIICNTPVLQNFDNEIVIQTDSSKD